VFRLARGRVPRDHLSVNAPLNIPLPRNWRALIKRGLVAAIGLERAALLDVRAGFENSPDPRARISAELDSALERIEVLEAHNRILKSRIEDVPPHERPHYRPAVRLEILQLAAKARWKLSRIAREFVLAPKTVRNWLRRLDEQGEDALLQTRDPVNAFDDAVSELVHALHRAAPGKGRRMKADLLLRTGLQLADSTVKRMLERPTKSKPEPPSPAPDSSKVGSTTSTLGGRKHVVTADRPHHVWHVDITTIPIGFGNGGFWVIWWPFALVLAWAFSWHIGVVLDHYSRAFLAFRIFRHEPSAADVCALLDDAVRRSGASPKYIISDQGTQFQSEYRRWCKTNSVKPRFGAVGQHGSIAIVERFIRSMKDEFLRRIHVSASRDAMLGTLSAYQTWYNEHRPHSSLDGRTPGEVLRQDPAPLPTVLIEPRTAVPLAETERSPPRRRARGPLSLAVGYVDGYRELPVLELREAA